MISKERTRPRRWKKLPDERGPKALTSLTTVKAPPTSALELTQNVPVARLNLKSDEMGLHTQTSLAYAASPPQIQRSRRVNNLTRPLTSRGCLMDPSVHQGWPLQRTKSGNLLMAAWSSQLLGDHNVHARLNNEDTSSSPNGGGGTRGSSNMGGRPPNRPITTPDRTLHYHG